MLKRSHTYAVCLMLCHCQSFSFQKTIQIWYYKHMLRVKLMEKVLCGVILLALYWRSGQLSFQLTEAKKLFAILVLTLHTEYKVFVSNPLVFEIETVNHKTNLKMFEYNQCQWSEKCWDHKENKITEYIKILNISTRFFFSFSSFRESFLTCMLCNPMTLRNKHTVMNSSWQTNKRYK